MPPPVATTVVCVIPAPFRLRLLRRLALERGVVDGLDVAVQQVPGRDEGIWVAEDFERFFSSSWNDEGDSGAAVEHGDDKLPGRSVPPKDDVDTLALPLREVDQAARLPLTRDRHGPSVRVTEVLPLTRYG
jgi:hypothetical protein